MDTTTAVLRHILATIKYRLDKSVHEIPTDFDKFDPGSGVRSPLEIMRHMTHVLQYLEPVVLGKPIQKIPEPTAQDWAAELQQFSDLLHNLDNLFDEHSIPLLAALQMIQGPLSDVLTHIGQIAMLRRLAGSPIPPESFMRADI